MSTITEIFPDYRNKGIATKAYIASAAYLAKQGIALTSDTLLTDDAVRLWESLVKKGYAEKISDTGFKDKYGYNEKQYKFIIDKVKDIDIHPNSSKVVDENGEPLVVYHHTDNPNLTEFSIDFDNYFSKDGGTKKAIFFDENITGTLNRKYDIPVFLNIRDLHEYNETKDQLHQRGTTYRDVVNQSAEGNDVDGGVHMNDFDDNGMEHQSIWIVHNPNQIKSATDNNGEFRSEDNNIYHNRTL